MAILFEYVLPLLELGIPASVDLVSSDPSHMVASFSKGYTSIFNMETQQRILTLESNPDTSMYTSLNSLRLDHVFKLDRNYN